MTSACFTLRTRAASSEEAHSARVRFFEKDALLLKKHPERVQALFPREGTYRHTAGFREHFLRGSASTDVPIDDFYSAL